MVIMDDIASLSWTGFSSLDLIRFSRAIRSLCLKVISICALINYTLITLNQSHASLVIRYHVVTPSEPDEILRQLLQLCTYYMDVRPLSSGRSGAVSGEVSLT